MQPIKFNCKYFTFNTLMIIKIWEVHIHIGKKSLFGFEKWLFKSTIKEALIFSSSEYCRLGLLRRVV